MAEPKRLEFKTITPTQKPKKKLSYPPADRFSLTLTDSTETTCPEFSYTELVKNAVREKERGGGDPDNPFGDDDDADKMEAIAKAFEEKYGPKVKTKKGRPSDRLRDLVDLGDGYDETDAFIDNSEAYDEIVPRCLTTKLGGFYINSGALDFRYASEDSTDDFQGLKSSGIKKKRKIRTIESDSDSNAEVKKNGPKKRKLKEGVDGEKKKKKRLVIGPDGEKIVVKRGRKPLDKNKLKKKTSPTVSELLKQQTASISTPTHAVNGGGGGDGSRPADEGYNPYDGISSTIEMLLKEDSESRDGDDYKKPETMVPLPQGLSDNLVQTITSLKKSAKESREGKCKFFSPNVNRMLLDVEVKSRQLTCGNRSSIFAHLSCFLPCGKETLLKRAKKLRQSQQDDLLRDPLNKLKEAVNSMMPTLLEKYDAENQLAVLMRMENKEKVDSEQKDPKEEGSTESDEEEQRGPDGEKKKRIMGPRKKFEWTDHVRNLLCEVTKVKMKTFAAAKQRGQTAEEYVRFFLGADVLPIWPKGWMQTRMLYKESRAAHALWTNPQKPRKSLQGTNKTSSPTPTSVPFGSRSNNNSIIEIFDSVDNDTFKEGSGSDKETGTLRLEDYMDITDVDNMLSEISKTDNDTSMPTILDYADKMNTSATGFTPDVKKQPGAVENPQVRPHSTGQAVASVQKSRDVKHGLVTEMLQSPLPSTPNTAKLPTPNILSPQTETVTQKSAYMAEFEKHLMATTTLKESPPKPQGSPNEQSASSKLQSMLAQAQASSSQHVKQNLATPKTSHISSAQHDQALQDIQKKLTSSPQAHNRLSLGQNTVSKPLATSLKTSSPLSQKMQGSPSQTIHNPHSTQTHKLSLSQGTKSLSAQPQKSPSVQQQKATSVQQPKTPSFQQQKAPSLQQQKAPSLQQQKAPSLQQQKAPSLQQQKAPSLQQQKAPLLQQQKAPSLQQQKAPSLQQQKTPSTQAQKISVGQVAGLHKKQYTSESRQKVESSAPKDLVVPSSLSSASIDQEAVKQLHQQLLQLANAQYKPPSKSVSSSKAGQDSVVGQLFKQPLPANMAAQQRQMQPGKTSVTSALKIDTQNSMGASPQRHSPQDQLRMSPQGQRHASPSQKQASSVHMSGGSLHSPTSSRKSPGEVSGKVPAGMGNQLSPNQARALLSMQSPSDSLAHAKRSASANDALSRKKSVEKSILEKVIEDYTMEMKVKEQQQQFAGSGQLQVTAPALSPSQGSLPRTMWQQTTGSSPTATGTSRMSAFSPPSGTNKPTKSVSPMVMSGYQGVKMPSLSKDSPTSTYSLSLQNMQQRSRAQDLIAGTRVSAPQPAHSSMSPNAAAISTFPSHSQPPAAHSTLPANQHQMAGLPPPLGSPHLFLSSATPTTTVAAMYGRTLPDPSHSPNRY
ncbi:ubinuclein-1-like isoform X1 [Haliotis cracherodii]|uniref:ubinuclein-1-like isoform X1 n=1 Tax=Haliotis cracherodii TaxID=6455 RepID=UPI0039EC8A91